MNNDKQIILSSAGSRKSTHWPAQTLMWSELVNKLAIPVRGAETLAEYLQLPKARQDDLKDVGGYVGGTLRDNRRKASNVVSRDLITLDLDNIPPGETDSTLRRIHSLNCAYVVYSTRKHEPAKPRLRVIFPLDRTVTADEYEPIARKMAEIIGIQLADPTTFEASRLMYWPSCCSDSQYVFTYADNAFLSSDGLLSMYQDWRDVSQWPKVPGEQQQTQKTAEKQEDPTTKFGIVGAFCRVYDIYKAIEVFLPGVYLPVENADDRLTFAGGSTTGGAVVYENGTFLYSHHATDPASGKLCNAFDLVRLHKFGHLDDEAKPDTPAHRLPSYKAMCELAVADSQVSVLLNQERYEKAASEFTEENNAIIDPNWIKKLKLISTTGTPIKSVSNIEIILKNDPALKGKIAYDKFLERPVCGNDLPWIANKYVNDYWRTWEEADEAGLVRYLQEAYGLPKCSDLELALELVWRENMFFELRDYLTSLVWDGVPRIDTIFIDYFGAEDTPYTRAITRKTLVAAVARVMDPGCKFDYMLILEGPQGIKKSSFLARLATNPKYYLDELRTFEGKEASELIQGKWIVEVAELSAFNKTETNIIKGFITRQTDTYRAAYGKGTKDYPRKCIFIGTTNSEEYLKDATGERRYWPLRLNSKIKIHLSEIPVEQIWAEAYARWQFGEDLYLPTELEEEAKRQQEMRQEANVKEGLILEFLEKPIPLDWNKRTLAERRLYWSSEFGTNTVETKERDRVCALEIWCECLGGDIKQLKKSDTMEINSILSKIPGWVKRDSIRFGCYGKQRGFIRVKTNL
jgi:putative DNA primase/helicase